MTESAAISFFVLFAIQAMGTVTYLLLIGRLFNRLKAEHAVVYESLGRPSLFLNNSIQNNMRVLRWLLRKEFEGLTDPVTTSSAKVVRLLLAVLSANFAALLAVFFAIAATVA
jgi:hypothetical protein